MRGVLLCSLALVGMVGAHGQTAGGRIVVVSEQKGPYRPAIEAAVAALRAAGHECTVIELPTGDEAAQKGVLKQLGEPKPKVLLTAGPSATERALEALADVPVVFCLVPNALDAAFLASDSAARQRVAGVTSDVDPAEQVEWFARTYPGAKKVGILCSERSAKTAAGLQEAGRKRGLELRAIPAQRDKFPDAIEALDQQGCDGAVMIPDAQVYNSPNVERLLLWGVRQKKPVWTFSENIIKAGAFSGLYCDAAEVGHQAAALVEEIAGGKAPPAIGLQYPRVVRRAVNTHTAEMIEISLDDKVYTSGVMRLGESQ